MPEAVLIELRGFHVSQFIHRRQTSTFGPIVPPLPSKAYFVIRLAPYSNINIAPLLTPSPWSPFCNPHPFLPASWGRQAPRPHFLGQSPGPNPSMPRSRLPLIFPFLQELHHWSFIPASSGSGTYRLPSLPATLLWMTDGFLPCPGLRLVSGTLTFEAMASSLVLLFAIFPSLSSALKRPCLCHRIRLS